MSLSILSPRTITLQYENWLSSQHLWLVLLSHCYDFAYLAVCNPLVLDWRSLPSVEGIQDCVLVPVFAKNLLGACSTLFARTCHSSFVILIHVIASFMCRSPLLK